MNNISKKDRINMVFSQLKKDGEIHNQAELAKAIGASEATISKALKGEEKSLTDNLFKRISKRFSRFSLDWMVKGEGTMCGCSADTDTDDSFYHPSQKRTTSEPEAKEERRTSEDLLARENELLRQQVQFLKEQVDFYKNRK